MWLSRGHPALKARRDAAAVMVARHDAMSQTKVQTHSRKALGTWKVSTSCASATTGTDGFVLPSDMARGVCVGGVGFGALELSCAEARGEMLRSYVSHGIHRTPHSRARYTFSITG